MDNLVQYHSLSALSPIKFTYKFDNEEKLTNSLTSLKNGLSFYSHEALAKVQDVVLSNHNLLVLTDKMPVRNVFDNEIVDINIGIIAGSLYLKSPINNKYVTYTKNNLYVGGTGKPLLFTVVPIEGNIVELIVNQTKKIIIDDSYPYTAKISSDVLTSDKIYRQRFEMELKDGKCLFKTYTNEGYRFLSYGADNVIRAIGLSLNEFVVNPYLFDVEFLTNGKIQVGFDPKTTEIKYHNEFGSFSNQKTVSIKTEEESDTHLLISCATSVIAKSNEVPVNIALTKTNFSSSGSYSTKQT